MTREEALDAVLEAAEYALENDREYLEYETVDRWQEAVAVIRSGGEA